MSAIRLATLTFDASDGATVATVTGEVDMSNADELLGELVQRIGARPWLILDLSSCTYLDSAGLGMIARVDVRGRDRGTGLRLVVADRSSIDRVLFMTGMHEMLIVDRSREAAVASSANDAVPEPQRLTEPHATGPGSVG